MSKNKTKRKRSEKKMKQKSSKRKKPKVRRTKPISAKKDMFYDAVADTHAIDDKEMIRFIKSSFRLSFMAHFMQKFFDFDLWRVIIGSFFAALFVGYNWHFFAIIWFTILMTSYTQYKNQEKSKAIEYCSKMLSKDPDRLKQFLDTISAPKNLNSGKAAYAPCEWLNDIMAKFWPNINSIAQNMIDKQGFSNQGLDVGNGHKIYFERFTLGDKAPALTSIHVRESGHRKDEIVIVLKLIYFGNCLILFSYKTKMYLKAKAGVKDIYFRGTAIIVLRPLIEVPPFIGGISVCLQEIPIMDYNGMNLANIADNKMFKNFLTDIINSYVVSPNKIYIPLINNANVKRQLKYPLPIGLCYFEIIEAEDLPSSDSFCRTRVGDYVFNTTVIYSSLNPYFGESFSAPIHEFNEMLKIDVFDKDGISNNDFMGCLEFRLADVGKNGNLNGRDKWLPIGRCPTGSLHFRIAVFELSSNKRNIKKMSSFLKQSKVKFPIGIVSVYVYYVSHISTTDEELDFKPMVKLKFSDQTFQTKVSKPPKKGFYYFEESTNFLCRDMTKDILEVSVVCQEMLTMKVAKKYGECNIAIKDIIDSKKDMTLNQEFVLKKILRLRNQTEVNNSGIIRMFVSLKVCKYRRKLIDNMNIAANVQANIENVHENQSNLIKLIREPVSSLTNPVRSCRIISNKISPFAPPSKTIVAEDMTQIPKNLRRDCWVKLRIKWPDRTSLHVEVLKLVGIPIEVVDSSYQYAVSVTLDIRDCLATGFMHSLKDSILPNTDNKGKLKRLQTKRTKKHSIVNFISDIDYNERLIFKISPKNNIDSHVLELTLIICQPRKYFAVMYDYREAAYSQKIDIPKVDFKGDPIEQWYELKLFSEFRQTIKSKLKKK